MGQFSCMPLAQDFSKAVNKVSARAASHLNAQLGEDPLPGSLTAVGRTQKIPVQTPSCDYWQAAGPSWLSARNITSF